MQDLDIKKRKRAGRRRTYAAVRRHYGKEFAGETSWTCLPPLLRSDLLATSRQVATD